MVLPRLRTITTVAVAGTVAGAFCYRDARSSVHDYVLLPVVRALFPDAETAHQAAIKLMKFPAINPKLPSLWLDKIDPSGKLGVHLFKNASNPRVRPLYLRTPVGVAAGLDKNGEAIDTLFQYGFSWVEIGSVTPQPQPGNPRPRMWRLLEDGAIVNRYGFNSDGHAAVLAQLEIREQQGETPAKEAADGRVLAVNLGKNKTGDEVEDYVRGVRSFGAHANALVVNVSSPNTPGLRDLQRDDKLRALLTRLVAERDALPGATVPPLLVKVAPDVDANEIRLMAAAIKDAKVDGIIVGNTTIGRPSTLKSPKALERGGLSGKPLKPIQLQALKQFRKELGPDLTIIGVGGISSGADAIEYAKAGANFVQILTSFVYAGPGKPAHITQEIARELSETNSTWESLSK